MSLLATGEQVRTGESHNTQHAFQDCYLQTAGGRMGRRPGERASAVNGGLGLALAHIP
jgi:hypothetical protein